MPVSSNISVPTTKTSRISWCPKMDMFGLECCKWWSIERYDLYCVVSYGVQNSTGELQNELIAMMSTGHIAKPMHALR